MLMPTYIHMGQELHLCTTYTSCMVWPSTAVSSSNVAFPTCEFLHELPLSAATREVALFITRCVHVTWVCKQWYQITLPPHSLLTLANPAQAQLAVALLLCRYNVFILLHCIHAFAL